MQQTLLLLHWFAVNYGKRAQPAPPVGSVALFVCLSAGWLNNFASKVVRRSLGIFAFIVIVVAIAFYFWIFTLPRYYRCFCCHLSIVRRRTNLLHIKLINICFYSFCACVYVYVGANALLQWYLLPFLRALTFPPFTWVLLIFLLFFFWIFFWFLFALFRCNNYCLIWFNFALSRAQSPAAVSLLQLEKSHFALSNCTRLT